MEKILNFIITQPSWAIIILLVCYTIVREIGIKNILSLIRGTQKEKYPKLETGQLEIMQELHNQNKILAQQNEKFATNHALHEIPDIKKSVDRMEIKIDKVVEKLDEYGNRLTILETINKVEGDSKLKNK